MSDSAATPPPPKKAGGPEPAPRRLGPAAAALILGVAGVGLPLILAALGAASPVPALVASAAMAALAGVLRFGSTVIGPAGEARIGRGRPAPSPTAPAPPAESAPAAATPFAAMLERLADPILLVAGGQFEDSTARRFVFANSAARELLRLQRGEGPLTMAVRAPEVLTVIDRALYEATAGEAIYEPGGPLGRVWRAGALPLPLPADPAARSMAVVVFRDETEFRRSERTRADFLANASHELRTPLASLAGFIETLRGHARDDEVAREKFLAIMHVQALRMRRLIDDLLSLSRIELGEHIPPSGNVDLAVAVIDVVDALTPLAAERGVSFRADLPPVGQAEVVGERDQILQVIQNLAENALKYTAPGATVKVEVKVGLDAAGASAPMSAANAHRSLLSPERAATQRYAMLRVSDAGPGIGREHLPRLTERFYRVEGQKSGEHAGTGLGLAIVKHIVNRHRGGLTVESAEGRGSVFTFYLPEKPPPPPAEPVPAP